MQNKFLKIMLCLAGLLSITSCKKAVEMDGKYDFIIYESDKDNSDLSDNKVVAKFTIEYKDCKYVSDTLIKKEDNKYYFSSKSNDYLVMYEGDFGLYYTNGYFKNFSECNNGEIDVSWSMTKVNGQDATTGIGTTPLEGLTSFEFIINGWK